MARKLKVYRTPIGFHDAYVEASDQTRPYSNVHRTTAPDKIRRPRGGK